MHAATRPLRPDQVARLLQSAAAALTGELRELPHEVLAWHPAAGEWCAKECLGHIVEADRRAFNGRIRTILNTPEPTFLAWDQDAAARERNDCQRQATALLTEFLELRKDSVALVGALTEADLERGGTHPQVGYLRVRDLLHEWVHHDRNHFRQLLANVQAYVWPAMGNTCLFSEQSPLVPEALPLDPA
ncbi:MAG: DinB family protein [Chloroflexota bacterium]